MTDLIVNNFLKMLCSVSDFVIHLHHVLYVGLLTNLIYEVPTSDFCPNTTASNSLILSCASFSSVV